MVSYELDDIDKWVKMIQVSAQTKSHLNLDFDHRSNLQPKQSRKHIAHISDRIAMWRRGSKEVSHVLLGCSTCDIKL